MKEVWGKDGKVYYVDDNGNRLQSGINPLQKFGRQIQAGLTNINDWINESDPNSEAYKQKANLVLGLSTMPIGGGLLSNVGANLLKPYIGRKMAQTVAQGVGSGATGGAVEGFGRGVIEGKNPLKTMATDATIGALTGGATGYGLSKIAKHLEGKQIFNNPLKQDEYYKNYVEGLKRADKLGQESPLSKGLAEYTALRDGFKYKPSSKVGLFDLISDENGNVLSFYHGTPNAGFTKFNPLSHFSKNKDYASIYKNPSASSMQIKQTANNPGVYEVNLDVNKMFDTRNTLEKNIFNKEYQAYYSPELTDKGLPDWMEAEDLAEWLQSNYPEYDALIVDEGATGGYGDIVKDRGESYIPFKPEQVKIQKLVTDKGETIFNTPQNNLYNNIVKKPLENLKKADLKGKINYIDMMDDAEKARVTSEFNTNLSKAQLKRKNIRKAVGNYYYTAKNNGFDNYEFTGRYLIDDLYD
jgi:hypothetical protein